MKITIHIARWHFYLITSLIFLLIVTTFVAARYANTATGVGHDINEIDWSQVISGDVKINGRLGIGTSTPSANLDVAGDAHLNGVRYYAFGGMYFQDGVGCFQIPNPITGGFSCPPGFNDYQQTVSVDTCAPTGLVVHQCWK